MEAKYINELRKITGLRKERVTDQELVKMWRGSFLEASILWRLTVNEFTAAISEILKETLIQLKLINPKSKP